MKEKYKNVICKQRKRNVFGLPWTFTEYILTDKKIIIKTGFFSIKEEEVELYKVTDKKLIAASGGIVQGMSGSPIVQDGKLIGAVTHVSIKNPTIAYGIYIEWMFEDMGINVVE